MRVKLGTAIERAAAVMNNVYKQKGMIALKDFNDELVEKYKTVRLMNPPGFALGERITKYDALQVWKGASQFKQKSQALNLKASHFRALND